MSAHWQKTMVGEGSKVSELRMSERTLSKKQVIDYKLIIEDKSGIFNMVPLPVLLFITKACRSCCNDYKNYHIFLELRKQRCCKVNLWHLRGNKYLWVQSMILIVLPFPLLRLLIRSHKTGLASIVTESPNLLMWSHDLFYCASLQVSQLS